jgi:hypothetical protein
MWGVLDAVSIQFRRTEHEQPTQPHRDYHNCFMIQKKMKRVDIYAMATRSGVEYKCWCSILKVFDMERKLYGSKPRQRLVMGLLGY